MKASDKKTALKSKNKGIRTNDPKSVLTFNLIENKYNTVMLDFWDIITFLTITPDNIEILDSIANDMLKRPIENDLNSKNEKSK